MGTQRTHRSAGHRAVGYVRRSTDRQEQSITDQKRALEAYVLEHCLAWCHADPKYVEWFCLFNVMRKV